MYWRIYDPKRDLKACERIWYETGWLRPERPQTFEAVSSSGPAYLSEVDGQPECLAITSPGFIRFQRSDLAFTGVMAVTTSRVGRRQGLAAALTARAVAEQAASGAAVAGLGIFDQGYYDKLGFGSGPYEHIVSFDPMSLNVKVRPRKPERLGVEHVEAVHAARSSRARGHGGVVFTSPKVTLAGMVQSEHAFGLGYFSGSELTHHLWCLPEGDNRNQGPFRLLWLHYRSAEELRELLALLGDLGDQVLLVRLREPPGIQIQDFLDRPFRRYAQTGGARFEMRNEARAYWQMRICDIEACVGATSVGSGVRFNLELEDPIEAHLEGSGWRGVGGDYVVSFGEPSHARPGSESGLPILRASVGAFTRLWLGVLPASGLEASGGLSAPPGLLASLDATLRLPQARPDWDF